MGNRNSNPSQRSSRPSIISAPIYAANFSNLTESDIKIRHYPLRHKRRHNFHLHSLQLKNVNFDKTDIDSLRVVSSHDKRTQNPPRPFSSELREVHIQITLFYFLSIADICNLSQVNCYFYREANQDKLWIKLLKRDFPALIPIRLKNIALAEKRAEEADKIAETIEEKSHSKEHDGEKKENSPSNRSSGIAQPTPIRPTSWGPGDDRRGGGSIKSSRGSHKHDKFHPSHADLLLAMVGDHGAPTLRRSSSALAGPVFDQTLITPARNASASISYTSTRSMPGLPFAASPPSMGVMSPVPNSIGATAGSPRSREGNNNNNQNSSAAAAMNNNINNLNNPRGSVPSLLNMPKLTGPDPAALSYHRPSGFISSGASTHRGSILSNTVQRSRSRSQSSTDAEFHSGTVHDPLLIFKEEQTDAFIHSEKWEMWDSGKKPAKFIYEDESRRFYDPCILSPIALAEFLKSRPDLLKGITDMCKAPSAGSAMELATRGLRSTWPNVELSCEKNFDYLRCFYFAWHGMKIMNRRLQKCSLDKLIGMQSYSLSLNDNGNPVFVFSIFSHTDSRQFFRMLLKNEPLVDLLGGPLNFRFSNVYDANPHKR